MPVKIALHNNALRCQDNDLFTLPADVKHYHIHENHTGAKKWWVDRALASHILNATIYGVNITPISIEDLIASHPVIDELHVNQHPTAWSLIAAIKATSIAWYDNGYLCGPTLAATKADFVRTASHGSNYVVKPILHTPSLTAYSDARPFLAPPEILWPVPASFAIHEPGELGANNRLGAFKQAVTKEQYAEAHGYPSSEITSRLSPHIACGSITPRQIVQVLGYAHPLVTELHWREFAYSKYTYLRDYPKIEIKSKMRDWNWDNYPAHIKAWQRGKTGFAVVDAGMKELWNTGFMDNRVRMIVASFLVTLLNVDWRIGAAWFMDTLCDADEAINTVQWQSAFSSGYGDPDHLVVMNPQLQLDKFNMHAYVEKHNPNPVTTLIIDYETNRRKALTRYEARK